VLIRYKLTSHNNCCGGSGIYDHLRKELIPTSTNKSQETIKPGPKKGSIYIPIAQQERMKEMYISGQTISDIARKTRRDFKTVAKIVRSADMVRFMTECREQIKDLIPDALEVLANEMKQAPSKERLKTAMSILIRTGLFEEPSQSEKETDELYRALWQTSRVNAK